MAATLSTREYRLDSIDLVRGLAIVIMALDHVRDYFMLGVEQDPMTNPAVAAPLFFTRWVTHFCAPVFVFLAGTSAALMGARKARNELAAFLVKRGCWLIVVEVVLISTAWTFAPTGIGQLGGRVLVPMQVIWVIGLSMVVLAGLQYFGRRACLALGLVIVAGHNLLDPVWPATQLFDEGAPWWVPLHGQASYALGPVLFSFAYPALPWIGVMLLGFGAAGVFEQPAARRDRLLVLWGCAATLGFVLLRYAGAYGDPNPWQLQGSLLRTAIDFLNVSKYPPSLLFLLMTLGPAAVLCACADAVPAAIRRGFVTFGRVPFAFYVAHVYLIHALSVCLGLLQGFRADDMLTIMFFYPQGFGIGLPGVYAVWLAVVVALYPLARWVAGVKARRRDWWLSYI